MKGLRGIEIRRGKYRDIERQTIKSVSSIVVAANFWGFLLTGTGIEIDDRHYSMTNIIGTKHKSTKG
ncbi:hypothetical protein CMV_007822 [Castanea mollissima]|uniref:Uncharacterized protein n=1 Tax=Castanea mollissima TaxID=60419 RepID=A0A8J4VSD1_9ROSI|nr:hypothetical protein CMV_007822 [Castanea mollissima]